MIFKPVRTPCVGICSTGIGDDVCRGCKRFGHEVIHWNGYSNEQRLVIVERLQGFLAQVVANHIVVVDSSVLRSQLEHQQIAFQESVNPHCWVFDLLKAGASQINDLSEYGLAFAPGKQGLSLVAVKQLIDQDFYDLSVAHYQRYFAIPAEP